MILSDLDRRAFDCAVRTEDAAVAGLRPKKCVTRLALKADKTGVGRHLRIGPRPAVRTSND